jgi:acetyltransferase-like isoleucine patch superfamily enzyme
MRGRDQFRAAKPWLEALARALRCLPAGCAATAFDRSRHLSGRMGLAWRYLLLRRLSRHCGDCVAIFPGSYFFHLDRLSIGNHVSIHPMCYLDAAAGMEIGDHVSIAHSTSILTTEHSYHDPTQAIRDTPCRFERVSIADDVWIGCGVRILAGVDIGTRCVIGAGAVVTHSIPPNSLAAGVPARVIRSI